MDLKPKKVPTGTTAGSRPARNSNGSTLPLVISAIKNLKEIRGSTSKDIVNFISKNNHLNKENLKKQVKTSLKRGVDCGILVKENGNYYSLPTGSKNFEKEIAAQEIGLIELICSCRNKVKRNKSDRSKIRRMKRDRGKKSKNHSKYCRCTNRNCPCYIAAEVSKLKKIKEEELRKKRFQSNSNSEKNYGNSGDIDDPDNSQTDKSSDN